MKLQGEIGDQKYSVEIQRDGRKVFASVDGRQYDLEVSEPEPGVFLIKHEGRIYEAFVSAGKNTSDPDQIRIGTHELEVQLFDPKRLRSAGKDDAHSKGAAEIRTVMPGKVVRIIAAAGTEVKKGDSIVVVEAMKMQNELKSPKDGTVTEVRVAEGATVNAADILAVVE